MPIPRPKPKAQPSPSSPPWPLRLAYLHAVQDAAPEVLDSLRALLPNEPLLLGSLRASRKWRDYPDDVEPEDGDRYALARADWLRRLTAWATRWYMPAWAIEAAEETLEHRRLLLLYGVQEPVPCAWVPAEHVPEDAPVWAAHDQLVLLARFQHLGVPVSQLAWDAQKNRRDLRTILKGNASELGMALRPPSPGGRRRRAAPGPRQLVLRRTFVLVPVKGVVR